MNDYYDEFYSTTHEMKVNALKAMVGETINISEVLDSIADGAGGCERMSYSTPSGDTCWVSCMGHAVGRTQVAYIEINADGVVTFTTYCGLPLADEMSDDHPTRYAEVIAMVQEYREDE